MNKLFELKHNVDVWFDLDGDMEGQFLYYGMLSFAVIGIMSMMMALVGN